MPLPKKGWTNAQKFMALGLVVAIMTLVGVGIWLEDTRVIPAAPIVPLHPSLSPSSGSNSNSLRPTQPQEIIVETTTTTMTPPLPNPTISDSMIPPFENYQPPPPPKPAVIVPPQPIPTPIPRPETNTIPGPIPGPTPGPTPIVVPPIPGPLPDVGIGGEETIAPTEVAWADKYNLESKLLDVDGSMWIVSQGERRKFTPYAWTSYLLARPYQQSNVYEITNPDVKAYFERLPIGAPVLTENLTEKDYYSSGLGRLDVSAENLHASTIVSSTDPIRILSYLEGKPVSLQGRISFVQNGFLRWFSPAAWDLFRNEHPVQAAELVKLDKLEDVNSVLRDLKEGPQMPDFTYADIFKQRVVQWKDRLAFVDQDLYRRWFDGPSWEHYLRQLPNASQQVLQLSPLNSSTVALDSLPFDAMSEDQRKIYYLEALPRGLVMPQGNASVPLTLEYIHDLDHRVIDLDGRLTWNANGELHWFNGEAWAAFQRAFPERTNESSIVRLRKANPNDASLIAYVNQLPPGADMPVLNVDFKDKVVNDNGRLSYVDVDNRDHWFDGPAWSYFMSSFPDKAKTVVTISDPITQGYFRRLEPGIQMPSSPWDEKVVFLNDLGMGGGIFGNMQGVYNRYFVHKGKLLPFKSEDSWSLFQLEHPMEAQRDKVVEISNKMEVEAIKTRFPIGQSMPERTFPVEGKVVQFLGGLYLVQDRRLRWFSGPAWDLYQQQHPNASNEAIILQTNQVTEIDYLQSLPLGAPMPNYSALPSQQFPTHRSLFATMDAKQITSSVVVAASFSLPNNKIKKIDKHPAIEAIASASDAKSEPITMITNPLQKVRAKMLSRERLASLAKRPPGSVVLHRNNNKNKFPSSSSSSSSFSVPHDSSTRRSNLIPLSKQHYRNILKPSQARAFSSLKSQSIIPLASLLNKKTHGNKIGSRIGRTIRIASSSTQPPPRQRHWQKQQQQQQHQFLPHSSAMIPSYYISVPHGNVQHRKLPPITRRGSVALSKNTNAVVSPTSSFLASSSLAYRKKLAQSR